MNSKGYFDIGERERSVRIEAIVFPFAAEEREGLQARIARMVQSYEGRDDDVLQVLEYAKGLEGKVVNMLLRFEGHYAENLRHIPPERRKREETPREIRTEIFFERCFADVGIDRRKKKPEDIHRGRRSVSP